MDYICSTLCVYLTEIIRHLYDMKAAARVLIFPRHTGQVIFIFSEQSSQMHT